MKYPVGYSRWVVLLSPVVFVNFKRLSTKSWISLARVFTTCVGLNWLFRISWAFRSSWVRGRYSLLRLRRLVQHLGSVWKVFEWPVVWVCALLFGSGRFLFLFWIVGSSLRTLGGLLRSGSIWLRYWCTYLCCVLGCCTSHTSLLFHSIFSLCVLIWDMSYSSLVFHNIRTL